MKCTFSINSAKFVTGECYTIEDNKIVFEAAKGKILTTIMLFDYKFSIYGNNGHMFVTGYSAGSRNPITYKLCRVEVKALNAKA